MQGNLDVSGPSVEIPEGNLEIDAKGKIKSKKPKVKMPTFKRGVYAFQNLRHVLSVL